MWVTDETNKAENDAIAAYLDSPPAGITINYETLKNQAKDLESGILDLCTKLDGMIDSETPPDLIVDSAKSGFFPDVVRTTSYTLGLPTLSLNYHNQDTSWQGLNSAMQNYLVHVRPPGDVIPGIIREVISRQNITNAAILYDNSFGKSMLDI